MRGNTFQAVILVPAADDRLRAVGDFELAVDVEAVFFFLIPLSDKISRNMLD